MSKRTIFTLTGVVCVLNVLLSAAVARAEILPLPIEATPVFIAPERVFVPLGFDDNDNVQVVLDGKLADICERLGSTEARVDRKNHVVHVWQRAYSYSSSWCAKTDLPFFRVVDLGKLEAGEYQVAIHTDGVGEPAEKVLATFPVAKSSTVHIDEVTYAPVTNVELETPANPGPLERLRSARLTIEGTFPADCMKLDTVQIRIRENNVIEILPVLAKHEVNCPQILKDYKASVHIEMLAAGRYLLHVRSANGRALNRVVEVQ